MLVLGDPFSAIGLALSGLAIFALIFPLALRNPRRRLAAELGKVAFARELARAEGLELEDPQALHEAWPDLPLPGPVRRLWRGRTRDGRTFRLMLLSDPSGTMERSGYEGLLVERAPGIPSEPAGDAAEEIRHGQLVALVRPTALVSGPTAKGLLELRDAA